MLNVALTGNIASGKSSVVRLFHDWGATVIDADALVRRLQRPGTAIFQAIVDRFGPRALAPDGSLQWTSVSMPCSAPRFAYVARQAT